jgi:hypothetical protein
MGIGVWFDNPRVDQGGLTVEACASVLLCTFTLRLMHMGPTRPAARRLRTDT